MSEYTDYEVTATDSNGNVLRTEPYSERSKRDAVDSFLKDSPVGSWDENDVQISAMRVGDSSGDSMEVWMLGQLV